MNVLALAILTTCLAFSPDFITLSVLRLLSGFCGAGHFNTVFVWGIHLTHITYLVETTAFHIYTLLLGVEAVGVKYRIICGFIYQMLYSFGCACLGVIAFFVHDWMTLQLIISVPMFALVLIYW